MFSQRVFSFSCIINLLALLLVSFLFFFRCCAWCLRNLYVPLIIICFSSLSFFLHLSHPKLLSSLLSSSSPSSLTPKVTLQSSLFFISISLAQSYSPVFSLLHLPLPKLLSSHSPSPSPHLPSMEAWTPKADCLQFSVAVYRWPSSHKSGDLKLGPSRWFRVIAVLFSLALNCSLLTVALGSSCRLVPV